MNFKEPVYITEWKFKPLLPRGYKSFHGLDEVASEIVEEIRAGFGRKRKDQHNKEAATVSIVASIHQCMIEGRPLGVSLDANNYKANKQLHPTWFTYRHIKGALDLLESCGFVLTWKGYPDLKNGGGWITKVYASERLLELFIKYAPVAFETVSHQTVVMRNDFKENITYTANEYTRTIQSFVDRYNQWIGGFKIMLGDRQLGTEHTAIYSRSRWDKHGRYYNDQTQNLPATERAKITINGENVVEIDYTSHHPRLAYAMEGIEPVAVNGDYYTPVLDYLRIAPALRLPVKKMMSIMFNARDELEAANAFREWIGTAKTGAHTAKKAKVNRVELAMEDGNIDCNDLITAIEEVHAAIAHRFCSDSGVDLMFADSTIIRNVLERLIVLNIPAMPVHDSVIVPARHEKEVERIMEEELQQYVRQARQQQREAYPYTEQYVASF